MLDPTTIFSYECPMCRTVIDTPPTRESYGMRNLISSLRSALGERVLFAPDEMACEDRVDDSDFFVGLFLDDDRNTDS